MEVLVQTGKVELERYRDRPCTVGESRVTSDSGEIRTVTFFPLYVSCLELKQNNNWPNSENPDETAHYEPSHLDFHCLQWYCNGMSEFTRMFEVTRLSPKHLSCSDGPLIISESPKAYYLVLFKAVYSTVLFH